MVLVQKASICGTYPRPPITRSSLFSWFFLMTIYLLFFSLSLFLASGQCTGNQQILLLQFKNNLTFDSNFFTKLATWNQSVDCCSWEGITCSDGHVIGLDLSHEHISTRLDNSSSLFHLSYLQSLNLAHNSFDSSTIPLELGKFINLRYLNLSASGFEGQIPIVISHLTRLVVLDLSFGFHLEIKNTSLNMLIQNLSELTELYLDGIFISENDNKWGQALSASLPNLRVLSLSDCGLSGPIDSSLQNLQFLSIIHLDHNNFSAAVPEFFANFKNLTSLDLTFCELNDIFPKKIFQVSTLQELYLSGNSQLRGSLLESIGNLKLLSKIDISNCNFTGSIPKSMEKLTELVYLDMSMNHLSGSIPVFSMSKNLTYINLWDNNLSGHITSTQWEKLMNLEVLDLDSNLLDGNVPISLFSLPSLWKLRLSANWFFGQLNEFFNISSSLLEELDLSSNNLEGPIPKSIFELQSLQWISLSSNSFSGSLQLGTTQLRNLLDLDLSYNHLMKVEYHGPNISLSPFPQIQLLSLAFNNMKMIPNVLRNLSNLSYLDLSNNQIGGEMPNWICNFTELTHLNLSYNSLVTLKEPFLGPALEFLDLHSNQLQGPLPANIVCPTTHQSIFIPYGHRMLIFLSSNMFSGSIPKSICNSTGFEALDFSNNLFSGMIPQCLLEWSFLSVLNLGSNNLSGTISNVFPDNCGLHALILKGNQLEGELPKSLSNCKKLEALDIGNNNIEGTFPFYLKDASQLRFLVLRSNNFYGPISHLGRNSSWPMLQILDVALNNFSGRFPTITFSHWKAMISEDVDPYVQYFDKAMYVQISITITSKGSTMTLVKILTIYASLDFSCNNFNGPIPKEIGELKMLYALNLSHNAFWGPIPPSLGKLTNLESLDLSSNNLTGKIPVQLADGLIFLSVLNLSFNQLEGQIPKGKQFATFENTSFEGNKALCGFPLSLKCMDAEPRLLSPIPEETHLNSKTRIDWNYISIELGFVFGLGIVILPLMFWKKWRVRYYQHVDNILFEIFPQLYLRGNYHRRGAHNNQGLRR